MLCNFFLGRVGFGFYPFLFAFKSNLKPRCRTLGSSCCWVSLTSFVVGSGFTLAFFMFRSWLHAHLRFLFERRFLSSSPWLLLHALSVLPFLLPVLPFRDLSRQLRFLDTVKCCLQFLFRDIFYGFSFLSFKPLLSRLAMSAPTSLFDSTSASL